MILVPGDLITTRNRPGDLPVNVYVDSIKGTRGLDKSGIVEQGSIGILLSLDGSRKEAFVLFPGPILGWVFDTYITRVDDMR